MALVRYYLACLIIERNMPRFASSQNSDTVPRNALFPPHSVLSFHRKTECPQIPVGISLGLMSIGLKLSAMGSKTARSVLRSVHVALISMHIFSISVHTDLKENRTVLEPIGPKFESDGHWTQVCPNP